MFHASWCGWCKKMDKALNDDLCKKYFDDNFIIEHLTVLERKGKENLDNPGAKGLMDTFNYKNQGLPYWVILDPAGKLLFDSGNLGCPAALDEVNALQDILRQTTSLNDSALAKIKKRFLLNQE